MAQVGASNPLADARRAYNDGRFDDAIALAETALADPATANAAAVVLARARLERSRAAPPGETGTAADVEAARAALKTVDAGRLTPGEHVEYLIGLGESLYLEEPPEYAAAAEFFEVALERAVAVAGGDRDVVFDWWAGALDRLAQYGPESDRRTIYERVLAGAERHRRRDDASAVAWYWMAVAARGVGDIERAWGSAVAAWIRAGALGPAGVALRQDVDRLVMQVLLPERALHRAPADARSALPMLQQQWNEIKARWRSRL